MTTPDALWEVEWSLAVAAAEAASFIMTTQETKIPHDSFYQTCRVGSTD